MDSLGRFSIESLTSQTNKDKPSDDSNSSRNLFLRDYRAIYPQFHSYQQYAAHYHHSKPANIAAAANQQQLQGGVPNILTKENNTNFQTTQQLPIPIQNGFYNQISRETQESNAFRESRNDKNSNQSGLNSNQFPVGNSNQSYTKGEVPRCDGSMDVTQVTVKCPENNDVTAADDQQSGNHSDDLDKINTTNDDAAQPDDANGKPQHSYIALISEAILAYPEKKLVLSDIYQYIMDNYPYYNNQERAWRNSIRHNLSLNECFIKAGRAENGKGNYWAIHPACIEDFAKGDYRRRHARRRARGGPYADVSGLPYNYRCNLGFVPMTPATSLNYPYPLPYLPSLAHRQTINNALFRGSNSSDATAAGRIPAKRRDNASSSRFSGNRGSTAGSPQEALNQGTVHSTNTEVTATYEQNKNLLPHAYIHSMLPQGLRYSPYGFSFF